MAELNYLGQLISTTGVRPDPNKIEAVLNWPEPKSIKHIRAFLGLTSYYWQFMSWYAQIAAPLTDQLQKDGFNWIEEARLAFIQLKNAPMIALVLVFHDFSMAFVLEANACHVDISVMLLQQEHPIAYFSQKLSIL